MHKKTFKAAVDRFGGWFDGEQIHFPTVHQKDGFLTYCEHLRTMETIDVIANTLNNVANRHGLKELYVMADQVAYMQKILPNRDVQDVRLAKSEVIRNALDEIYGDLMHRGKSAWAFYTFKKHDIEAAYEALENWE